MLKSPKLFLITDEMYEPQLLTQCQGAVCGGTDAVIHRSAGTSTKVLKTFFDTLEKANPKCQRILNGPVNLSALSEMNMTGIHLSFQRALSYVGSPEAWSCLQEKMSQFELTLGVSVHSLAEWTAISKLSPDYVLVSHIFETTCKPGLAEKGIVFVSEFRNVLPQTTQVIGLGGINLHNCQSVIQAGADGVALRSALLESHSPKDLARQLKNRMKF